MFDKEFKVLRGEFEKGLAAHAYLFVGREKSGKLAFAVDLAKEVLGEYAKVDLIVLEGSESIKIKDVQGVIGKVARSAQGDLRIVVMEDVERLTLAAANSFLKTLEEPGEGTVFFLTCSNFGQVLPTIVSRTRVVRLFGGEAEVVFDTEMGREVKYLMEEGTVVARFKFVEGLANEDREKVREFLGFLKFYFREKMLKGEKRLEAANWLSKIENAGMLLEENVNVRLLLENLMLDLCP